MQFEVGDHVYLRVSPTKGVQWFGLKGKLAPRYIGPFEIFEICGPVAYQIRLPSRLAAIHDVFHFSQLKKCVKVPEEIIEQQDLEVECNEHGTIHAISSDFGDRMTTQSMGLEHQITFSDHTTSTTCSILSHPVLRTKSNA